MHQLISSNEQIFLSFSLGFFDSQVNSCVFGHVSALCSLEPLLANFRLDSEIFCNIILKFKAIHGRTQCNNKKPGSRQLLISKSLFL